MESSQQYLEQQQQQQQPPPRSTLFTHFHQLSSLPLRTASSTPMSSPGLFNPGALRHNHLHASSVSESNTPAPLFESPYLHPLQNFRVRETHKALIDSDIITGRKSINQYEVIEEIGRGMHGKVKLARNLQTGDNVAIKIIPRFSKKRRLGKVTAMSPQDKTKKEIAILKKIRHPNVVALLEVIDDPELKKIYMVLEHVELGEIVWRKKGLPHVCQHERKRVEREMRGDPPTAEETLYDQMLERRQAIRELKRAKMAQNYAGPVDYWSVEHGAADDGSSVGPWSRASSKEDFAATDGSPSQPTSRRSSLVASRSFSTECFPDAAEQPDEESDWNEDIMTPGPLPSAPGSASALDGTMFGTYAEQGSRFRERSPSMADSIISHMSSIDYNPRAHDPFADDFSYVPCFTFDQARSAFRDTVLGLDYLHYQGVVHRDIKPANLLSSKDHRVKISDFGVSYFGRPIRDGEPDDLVSESEAKDFDDDLELSKTVGTPAFFAPELCYTDPDRVQPKVSEQIDVWSLGVTLYCLIYARIPFLAEDEFQMFRKIATEDVYIPHRRLKPVDPSTSPTVTSLYKRQNTHPYRDDNDLEYEDVDDMLYDLLRQMLTKNPEKRIRLKDIKRHPWVLQGMANPAAWLDETDPARPTSGRKIQVDERDLSSAVVPLTFLERARSAVKKAVGKVMHPLVDRSDSRSRRRATSSAASSAGDSMFKNAAPATPQFHNDRRRSLRPDDVVPNASEETPSDTDAHLARPLAMGTQQETVAYDPMATVLPPLNPPMPVTRGRSHSELSETAKQEYQSAAARLSHHLHGTLGAKRSQHFLPLSPHLCGPQTLPNTPVYDGPQDLQWDRSFGKGQESTAPHPLDRSLFGSADKRASPHVSLNAVVAPGSIQGPRSTRSMRSVDLGKGRYGHGLSSSPLSCSSQSASTSYQLKQPHSDPNFYSRYAVRADERPLTAHRMDNMVDVSSPLTRNPITATTEQTEAEAAGPSEAQAAEAYRSSPPPPVDSEWPPEHPEALSRGYTMTTLKTASTDSMDRLGTPFTSPSETASPVAACPPNRSASQRMLAFQSDPSLPALLSGASSISADLEGELLGKPGVVSAQPSLLETRDSLTPPALAKESVGGFPIDQVLDNSRAMENGPLSFHLRANRPSSSQTLESERRRASHDDDDDGSDDEFLLMAKSRKRPPVVSRGRRFEARRRDTNISTASDETAKGQQRS